MVHLLTVYVIQAVFILMKVVSQDCDTGWFGPECKYMCHCNRSQNCSEDGECDNNEPCAKGYFGPGCQYRDAVPSAATADSANLFLSDSDDETCNPNAGEKQIRLTFKIAYPFSWIRIVVNNNEHIGTFKTWIGYKTNCTDEKKFMVNNNTVDVTCDTRRELVELWIIGEIAGSLCSIYSSAGRNLALKAYTRQSSNYDSDLKRCGSFNAVDGNTQQECYNGPCSRTDLEFGGGAEWNLTFTSPVVLNSIRIYGWKDHPQKNYTLEARSDNGHIVAKYEPIGNLDVNEKIVYSGIPIKTIGIKQKYIPPSEGKSLTICELETFGDAKCPDLTYGLFCNKTCACGANEVCNYVTGGCSLPTCNKNCQRGFCDDSSVKCLRCKDGHVGDDCTPECSSGTYGKGCAFTCSKDCYETCNKKDGKCSSCIAKHYGPQCENLCSVLCLNETCHHLSGNCLACQDGYTGDQCEEIEWKAHYWLLLIGPATFLLLVVVICVMCCKKDKVLIPDTNDSNIDTTNQTEVDLDEQTST